MGVDTSIDEFFDEHLQRVLGASPATAETGSWYPAPTQAIVGGKDEVPDPPRVDEGNVRAGVVTHPGGGSQREDIREGGARDKWRPTIDPTRDR